MRLFPCDLPTLFCSSWCSVWHVNSSVCLPCKQISSSSVASAISSRMWPRLSLAASCSVLVILNLLNRQSHSFQISELPQVIFTKQQIILQRDLFVPYLTDVNLEIARWVLRLSLNFFVWVVTLAELGSGNRLLIPKQDSLMKKWNFRQAESEVLSYCEL